MSPYLDDRPGSHGPLRIAILESDEPIGKTKEKYGTYGGLFEVLLEGGAKYLADKDSVEVPKLDISKHDIVNTQDYPNLDDIDAILLTGSRKFTEVYSMSKPRLIVTPRRMERIRRCRLDSQTC